jgi:hypothetical protein
LKDRGKIGVIGTAMDIKTVYPILVHALQLYDSKHQHSYPAIRAKIEVAYVRGSEDCSVPVAHHHVFAIGETVRASL